MNFKNQIIASTIGVSLVFVPLSCITRSEINEIKIKAENAQLSADTANRRIKSMFYEFSDDCTWIDLSYEQATALLGTTLGRKSDNRPPKVIHLYACMNFKDWPE